MSENGKRKARPSFDEIKSAFGPIPMSVLSDGIDALISQRKRFSTIETARILVKMHSVFLLSTALVEECNDFEFVGLLDSEEGEKIKAILERFPDAELTDLSSHQYALVGYVKERILLVLQKTIAELQKDVEHKTGKHAVSAFEHLKKLIDIEQSIIKYMGGHDERIYQHLKYLDWLSAEEHGIEPQIPASFVDAACATFGFTLMNAIHFGSTLKEIELELASDHGILLHPYLCDLFTKYPDVVNKINEAMESLGYGEEHFSACVESWQLSHMVSNSGIGDLSDEDDFVVVKLPLFEMEQRVTEDYDIGSLMGAFSPQVPIGQIVNGYHRSKFYLGKTNKLDREIKLSDLVPISAAQLNSLDSGSGFTHVLSLS